MDNQLTAQDIEFMRWVDGKDAEAYWDKDEHGEKVILRSGWNLAQIEYNRIKGLENSKSDLKK